MENKKKKNLLIIALCLALVFMGVGYALLSTSLNITGTNTVAGKWDIFIESITPTSIGGEAVSRSVTLSDNKLSANFVVDLYGNDDYVEYTVVVKNNGNIPAKLSNIQTNVENPSDFITFSHTATLDKALEVNSTDSFTVRIAVNNPNGEELVDSLGIKYTLSLTYLQNVQSSSE